MSDIKGKLPNEETTAILKEWFDPKCKEWVKAEWKKGMKFPVNSQERRRDFSKDAVIARGQDFFLDDAEKFCQEKNLVFETEYAQWQYINYKIGDWLEYSVDNTRRWYEEGQEKRNRSLMKRKRENLKLVFPLRFCRSQKIPVKEVCEYYGIKPRRYHRIINYKFSEKFDRSFSWKIRWGVCDYFGVTKGYEYRVNRDKEGKFDGVEVVKKEEKIVSTNEITCPTHPNVNEQEFDAIGKLVDTLNHDYEEIDIFDVKQSQKTKSDFKNMVFVIQQFEDQGHKVGCQKAEDLRLFGAALSLVCENDKVRINKVIEKWPYEYKVATWKHVDAYNREYSSGKIGQMSNERKTAA